MNAIPYAVDDKDGKFIGFINGNNKEDAQIRLNKLRKGCTVTGPVLMHGSGWSQTAFQRENIKKRVDSACWRSVCQK